MVEKPIPEVEKFEVEEDEVSHCWCTYEKGGEGVKNNQCGKCKKYGHTIRTCTLKKRHNEIQERMKSFYTEHVAANECNTDMISCALLHIFI